MKKIVFILVFISPCLHGGITVNFSYDITTGDTTADYSGSWDVFTANLTTSGSAPSISISGLSNTNSGDFGDFASITGDIPFGDNGLVSGVASGDSLSFRKEGFIFGPAGYSAGEPILGSIFFEDTTLLDLGFDLNEIENGAILNANGNSISITASTVPEPSTYTLILSSIAAIISITTRRKRLNQSQ